MISRAEACPLERGPLTGALRTGEGDRQQVERHDGWKREWLDLDAENCSEHGWPLEWIPAGKVHRCDHFDVLLKAISTREAHLRWVREWSWY